MTVHTLNDILSLVEKPSRYLGSEINSIKKDLSRVKLRFALVFPDLYEIGTSHFGMQILYHILNSHPDIAAERVFAPAVDMEARLREAGLPLFSLESKEPISRFDILGFSLLYELNYTNILTILDLAKIPFLASERDHSQPLIIAGGPCTCNPEPVAKFFDAVVLGDGEQVVMHMAETWLQWRQERPQIKENLLKKWSDIEGIYIPSFFEEQIDGCGFQTVTPQFSSYTGVKRAIIADLDKMPFPEKPILPYGKPVHDRLRLEVARGCTRGCRFCQAGMIYRPVRERSPEHLMSLSAESLAATGYEDLSLLSLSTGDYGCIVPLIEGLMARFGSENVAVSLPSLRAGTLTPELMKLIKTVRKTGFTIAPEAGSQRLRDVIDKNISEKEIVDTVKNAFNLGWRVIKLYFMIGLPTETEDDLQEMVDLVKKLRKIKPSAGSRGKINVSVATFIPKPHTPFQWASQISLAESKAKLNWIHDQLKLPGIKFKWQNPEVSRLEGLWARGDRRLYRLLITAYNKGCKFDGWSDKFRYHLWEETLAAEGLDPDFYISRVRDVCEPLPWDHIDTRINKSYLKDEWEKAHEGRLTEDCRQGLCNQCGVCDFEEIELKTIHSPSQEIAHPPATTADNITAYKKVRVYYSKQDQAKFFGHLEMVNVFLRALRRARLPVKFSEGFHPKAKISFDDPLPIGLESQEEYFTLTVTEIVKPSNLVRRLNAHLPDGLVVRRCEHAPQKAVKTASHQTSYLVSLQNQIFNEEDLSSFNHRSDLIISRSNRKGKLKKIDLKAIVTDIELLDSKRLMITLTSDPEKTVRPAEVLRHIFKLKEDQIKGAKIVKQKT